jgi:hypothetical protein
MTMTRPWRRITLHFSQTFFTLGRTFTLVPFDRPRTQHPPAPTSTRGRREPAPLPAALSIALAPHL